MLPHERAPIVPGMIQAAGIADAAEAALVMDCGVRYLGFPLRLPVHREDLTEPEAAAIVRALPPHVHPVLITYLDRADGIAVFRRELGVRLVQLHGDIAAAEARRLRAIEPGLCIIKSLVVGRHPVKTLERTVGELAPHVDAFITDTFAPETGASGATGRTHDWAVSRRLVEAGSAGVDVHTGVEDERGRKDRARVLAFVAEATAAFDSLTASSRTSGGRTARR